MRLTRAVIVGAVVLAGAILTVPMRSVTASAPAPVVFSYDVRGLHNRSSLEVLAASAAATYADPRGWSLGGTLAFRRVASGGDFTLWLAAASDVSSFGPPCDSGFSCRIGRNVVINEDRWLGASDSWNAAHGSLSDYQHMVVNHETGHWLGYGHQFCTGTGQLAPLMQQQSISLQGCRVNPWPLPAERQRLAADRGVRILDPDQRINRAVTAVFAGWLFGWVPPAD